MGESTNISWADSTHNEWIGCSHVSPGCERCYAEQLMAVRWKRVGWGPGNERALTSEENRAKPHAWNRAAAKARERRRVFSASLSDWLDYEVPPGWLAGLLGTVATTPHLDWLLLTKRPERWGERLYAALQALERRESTCANAERAAAADGLISAWLRGAPPANVWAGTTVEDQRRAEERVPRLLGIPARVRFLSCEPLLEAVDLTRIGSWNGVPLSALEEQVGRVERPRVDQIIIGGESQPGARPMDLAWARALRDQARAAGVAVWVKQLGGHPDARHRLEDFPPDMRLRELPNVPA